MPRRADAAELQQLVVEEDWRRSQVSEKQRVKDGVDNLLLPRVPPNGDLQREGTAQPLGRVPPACCSHAGRACSSFNPRKRRYPRVCYYGGAGRQATHDRSARGGTGWLCVCCLRSRTHARVCLRAMCAPGSLRGHACGVRMLHLYRH